MASKADEQIATAFAEWRGVVKTALDYIQADLKRGESKDADLWDAINDFRTSHARCRERCDGICQNTVTKSDMIQIKNDIEGIKLLLGSKCSSIDFKDLKDTIGLTDKEVLRQKITLVFYGLFGSGLFTLIIHLLKR